MTLKDKININFLNLLPITHSPKIAQGFETITLLPRSPVEDDKISLYMTVQAQNLHRNVNKSLPLYKFTASLGEGFRNSLFLMDDS